MIIKGNNTGQGLPDLLYPSSHISNDASKISEIYKDNINISIWKRKLNIPLLKSSEYILNQYPELEFSEVLELGKIESTLKSTFGFTENTLPFIEDISSIVNMFCKIFDLKQFWLRLDAINYPMCPRFHVDKVKCRLVTTYVGSGTQWLPHHLVNRSKLGHGNEGKADDKSGLFTDNKDIKQLDTGHVALLKGESWDGNQGAGLVHRSPNVEGYYKRLYMTIDFLTTYINIFKNR